MPAYKTTVATRRPVPARYVRTPARRPFGVFDDPFGREFFELSNRLFDSAFAGVDRRAAAWTPAVTVSETEKAFVVEAELPGIKREDIAVELDDNVLHVHGQTTVTEREGQVRHQTRRTGSFDYRLSLPGEVAADQVGATLADGVLRLEVPKAEPAQARKIEITDAAPAADATVEATGEAATPEATAESTADTTAQDTTAQDTITE